MSRMLLDAGVLIRFAMVDDPDHHRIVAGLRGFAQESWELCFAPQGVRETWNVLTRPIVNGGYGVTPEKAGESLSGAWASFTLLDDSLAVFRHWQALVVKYRIIGKSVHDANVVATALAHRASHLLTLNERDFRRYPEVETITIQRKP